MNLCDAKHPQHDHIEVMTDIGPMKVYDWKKYMDYKGYCTGQDDVSMTLGTVGNWDLPIKNLIMQLLAQSQDKLFVDVGAHVGYFSRLAINMGARVYAYECEGESLELLLDNAPGAERTRIWFDAKTEPAVFKEPFTVTVMKIDIEGGEQHAIRYFSELIDSGRVQNIIMEVSPTFNDSYPALIQSLVDKGYKVFELNGEPFNFDYNFPQTNLWLHL